MNSRLLLVKCITLRYRESLLEEKDTNSADLVRTVLEGIKLPEIAMSLNEERDILMALKDTALKMCADATTTTYSKEDLLQQLRVDCSNDDRLYDAYVQGIDRDMDEPSIKRTILSIRKYLNDTFRENEIISLFSSASTMMRFQREKIKDLRAYVREFSSQIEPFMIEANRKDSAIVNSVDFGDMARMVDVFQEIQDTGNAVNVLKTGWQGLNRMFQGGLRLAETVVIAALQHNYKTGFSLSIFRQVAQYNSPAIFLKDPKKKPLLLRISFEDSLQTNLQFLYQAFWQNEHGEMPSVKKVAASEMAAYVRERMERNGWHIRMLRVNPSDWTYKDIQNSILELEADGYEVKLLMLDYLAMIPTTGCEQGTMGHDLRDMWRRMRNFCSARDICLVSPHQLSTEAKMLIREGRTNFVKEVANKGYYDGTKRLDQEVDLEVTVHVERLNGEAYLTIQRGKHRLPTIIPETDKYLVLKFTEKGCILDDLDKPDSSLSKVGGGPIGTADEIPFFESTL